MTDAIAALEGWKRGHKARWARIEIDNGYGADCWQVILGNTNMPSWADWHQPDNTRGAVVLGAECSFLERTSVPTNVVYCETEEETFPGLAVVILATLELAKKLGL